jgi:hypothetical protein
MADGKQVKGYFDVEKPRFALEQGPTWLSIDESTGVLSGTPDAAGKVDVVVTASIDREVRQLDVETLKWGREKVLSVTTQRVGSDTQEFVIDVQPRIADTSQSKNNDDVLKISMLWEMEGTSGLFAKQQAWYWQDGVGPPHRAWRIKGQIR